MRRYDVITLISEEPYHGIFDDGDKASREVMCEVRSIGMKETYEALSNGLVPSFVFILSQPEEYKDEKIILYKGKRYEVLRTYINKGDCIEITVTPATVSRKEGQP